jgi:short-subunit dehydrogenase
MLKKKKGEIINIVSLAGLNPKALRTVYNASKWAMTGFTKSLALELEPEGIKVTGIYPGFMDTDLFKEYPNARDPDKGLELDEVAETVEFVLSRKPKTHILSVELKNIDY